MRQYGSTQHEIYDNTMQFETCYRSRVPTHLKEKNCMYKIKVYIK